MSDLSLLSGVKRKSDFGAVRSVKDPKRKSRLQINSQCHGGHGALQERGRANAFMIIGDS